MTEEKPLVAYHFDFTVVGISAYGAEFLMKVIRDKIEIAQSFSGNLVVLGGGYTSEEYQAEADNVA